MKLITLTKELIQCHCRAYDTVLLSRHAPPLLPWPNTAAPSDAELLGSMATRLALAERELLASKREIIMKV